MAPSIHTKKLDFLPAKDSLGGNGWRIHAAHVLELGKVLAGRGHTIEFATLKGQDEWSEDSVSTVYSMGPGPSAKALKKHYLRMREWDAKKGFDDVMDSKYIFDSFWTQTYQHMKAIMEDETTRPDMIVADFFVDAAKDTQKKYNVPITMVWPQMPFLMLSSSYIPGQPGFQIDMTSTSEHASNPERARPFPLFGEHDKIYVMNQDIKDRSKLLSPNHIEARLPSSCKFILRSRNPEGSSTFSAAIGPVLSDQYPLLLPSGPYLGFLTLHERIIHVALGSHIILKNKDAVKIIQSLLQAMDEDVLDGVIWAVSDAGRREFDLDFVFSLLAGRHRKWLFTEFAPQRAILEHRSTKV